MASIPPTSNQDDKVEYKQYVGNTISLIDGKFKWHEPPLPPLSEIPDGDFPFGYVYLGCFAGAYAIPFDAEWRYQRIGSIIDPNTSWPPDENNFLAAQAPFGRIPPNDPDPGSRIYPINTLWDREESLWLRREIIRPCSGTVRLSGHIENSAYFYLDGELFAAVNEDNVQIGSVGSVGGVPFDIEVPNRLLVSGLHTLDILALDEAGALPDNDATYFYVEIDGYTTVNANEDLYAAEILADSPVLYQKFDSTLGTVAADSSGNGIDGTIAGAAILGQGPLTTRGQAILFQGDEPIDPARVEFANTPSLIIVGDLCLETWVNFTSLDQGTILLCGAVGETLATNVPYLWRWEGAEMLFFHEYASGSNVSVNHSVTLLPGVDYHLAVERDDTAKTVSFYVNGLLSGSYSYANSAAGGDNCVLSIGYDSVSNVFPIDAVMDEVAIYDHLIGPGRIAAHYAAGIGA